MSSQPAATLFEGDVIDAICAELESRGYEIWQKASTSQHGDDILARKRGPASRLLYVDARGATSSKPPTRRFGKPFGSDQVRVHVAQAPIYLE